MHVRVQAARKLPCTFHRALWSTGLLRIVDQSSPSLAGPASLHLLPLTPPTTPDSATSATDHAPCPRQLLRTSVDEPHVQLPHLFGFRLRHALRVNCSPVRLEVELAAKHRRKLLLLARAFFAHEMQRSEVIAQKWVVAVVILPAFTFAKVAPEVRLAQVSMQCVVV